MKRELFFIDWLIIWMIKSLSYENIYVYLNFSNSLLLQN